MIIETDFVRDIQTLLESIRESYDFNDFQTIKNQIKSLESVNTLLALCPTLDNSNSVDTVIAPSDNSSDISSILKEELDILSENFVLDVCNEIKTSLSSVYPDKLLYPELMTQFVYQYFSDILTNIPYTFTLNEKQKQQEKERVEYLKTVPQPEQRTAAWYAYRNKRITASDMGCVFGKNPFCSRAQLLKKKVYPEEVENLSESNPFLNHGIKHEDTAIHVYEKIENVEVIEYGCIPHDTIECIGASPDGITDSGVMQEIKCPYSRPIYGPPPIYYWYQIQIQLEVAELNQCDYIETNIKEYPSEVFWERIKSEGWKVSHESGIMVEYMNLTDQKLKRIPYPVGASLDKSTVETWIKETIDYVITSTDHEYMNTLYWIMEQYSCMPIYRDPRWFKRNLKEITDFWKEVEHERAERIGKELHEDTTSREKVRSPDVSDCKLAKTVITKKTICCIDDSDDED